MNWEAIGAIGELGGAVAVVVTLFYLTAQIRQSTKATRASSRQALIDTFYDHAWELGKDAELNRIIGVDLSDFDLLSDEEKSRFNNLLSRWEGNLYNGILLHDADLLDEETLNEIGDRFVDTVQTKGGATWFETAILAPRVMQYIAARLAESGRETRDLTEILPYWIKKHSDDA